MFPRDPQEPKLIAWLRNARVRRLLILVVLWTFIATILVGFSFVLLPFAVAVLLAFIIEPLVDRMTTRPLLGLKLSRPAAVMIIYAATFLVLGIFGTWAIGQIGRELSKVGTVTANLIGELEVMSDRLLSSIVTFAESNHLPIQRDELEALFRQNLAAFGRDLSHNTTKVFAVGRDIIAALLRGIFGLFLVLMLTAVLTVDRERIQRFFYTLVPPEYQAAYRTVTRGMSVGLAGVVRGQVLICLTNGVLTFAGLWLFGVKLPLLLASIATVFSLIPIFGSILSTIPIVAIALTDSLAKGVFTLLWIIGIHILEANLLNPKIMGDAAKIHPIIVVFALIVGERTSGLIGALFAVPIASCVLTLFTFLHLRALSAVREAVQQGVLPESSGDLSSMDLPSLSLRKMEAPHPPPHSAPSPIAESPPPPKAVSE